MHPRFATVLPTLALAAFTAGSANAASLPAGVTSLSETYGDWVVACQTQNGAPRCQMTQTQTDQKTQQLYMAMEVRRGDDSAMAATLLMPFGLSLKSGVALQVDDSKQGMKAEFSTCLPNGCLAPISIDETIAQTILLGKSLNLSAVTAGENKPFSAKVSLNGFPQAWARLVALLK